MKTLRIDPSDTVVVVVDVQERLHAAMDAALRQRLEANVPRLGGGAQVLGVPAVITEQYPRGLGGTIALVREAFGGVEPMAKMTFDACLDEKIDAALRALGRGTALVCGMETHVCVYQTVCTLAERGIGVHVVADAVASRTRESYEIGLDLIRRAGAVVTTTETALFDMLRVAGTEQFRAISKLIR